MGEEVKKSEMGLSCECLQHHFVLVHGIGNGGWCWYKIKTLLQNSGHKVTCLDLKGAGVDLSHADSILSFEDYNQPLTDFMSALPDEEKVILVGHSAGGLSVTHASYKFAQKIQLAVYVAATMLQCGFNSEQDFKDGVPDLSGFGDVYDLGFGLGHDNPPTSAIIRQEFQAKIAYNQSPPEDVTLASMLLRPGPLMALGNAKFDSGDEIDIVRRVYIKTTHDNVVKPAQQEAMIGRWAPNKVFVLETDHSPFFSAPSHLFSVLLKAIDSMPYN